MLDTGPNELQLQLLKQKVQFLERYIKKKDYADCIKIPKSLQFGEFAYIDNQIES